MSEHYNSGSATRVTRIYIEDTGEIRRAFLTENTVHDYVRWVGAKPEVDQ